MKFSNLRLEAIMGAAICLLVISVMVGCNGGGSSPVAPVITAKPTTSAVIVYDESDDVALGTMPGASSTVVYTVVMANGTTWRSQTLAQLEALWE